MDEKAKTALQDKSLRATETAPSQGTDFYATFTGLSAGITAITPGDLEYASLERKRLDKRVLQHVASKVLSIGETVISVEAGTGTIPDLLSGPVTGSLVITDSALNTTKTYANSILRKISGQKYEAGALVSADLTFIINEVPTTGA